MYKKDIASPEKEKIWLSSPTMHGDELKYIQEAYDSGWMSTVGKNIDEIELASAKLCGAKYAVALSCGTAALHLAVKLAGVGHGDTVIASDMTFAATVNPIVYEGGIPVFADTERDTWNSSPEAIERAFSLYPDTKVVVAAELYGTPSKLDEISEICRRHGAVLIEDSAESLGASYKCRPMASFGKYNAISFNGNKIITGTSGGMLLTDDEDAAKLAKKWSTQSREGAAWYQHEQIGYNYRMSNVIAGVVRGQLPYLNEHIAQKKAIYERYKKGFSGLPVTMNPFDEKNSEPNFWLSCLLIDSDAMCRCERSDTSSEFIPESGKSCPDEILRALSQNNIEGRPIWKPMHLQPIYKNSPFVTAKENGEDVGADIFRRGLCLPSDNKMTEEKQNRIIEIVRSCFE